ncbi:2Fe-2S iron-sulfur cluster-binding protein [Paenibacillus alkaliterrae]|uniref:2Fe-2S iron-sulfur cluster-binding protein n=1 Tax=Paenibacillus alkaliterrae TaxID=320909 RepID=UPI001F3A4ACD|nr:2Fe-2S iron-sulfur cluster-binding protein [Paenibacillus alkaliterrae]MCF2937597.1 2Fe-2S iron-sulfur cluster-binding protein [Paenibacillus alkaliterrae]
MNGEITFWPSGRSIKVKPGTTLLDAARRANVPIKTRCGGKAACFMCKVTVRPGSELQPISDNERRKLAGMDGSHIRLACQARAAGKVDVEVPLDPLRAAVARQLARQAEEDGNLW